MSEFKGTPGPWRIDDEADGFAHVASDTYHQILAGDGFLGEEGYGFFIHAIMKNADAKLIAAAPDLLQTLQALVARIDYYASLPDRSEVNIEDWAYTAGSDDMNAARAALAKALGQ